MCEILDWDGDEPPPLEALRACGVRHGVMPPNVLLRALAATYPEAETNPLGALQRVLADAGLIPAPVLSVMDTTPAPWGR